MLITKGIEPASGSVGEPMARMCSLTPREGLVVQLIAQGFHNKAIAARLRISPHTVASYIRRIYAKLGVNNRIALATMVVTENMRPNASGVPEALRALERPETAGPARGGREHKDSPGAARLRADARVPTSQMTANRTPSRSG
jgi:DNA-binding CsgD family transcriptional regulator